MPGSHRCPDCGLDSRTWAHINRCNPMPVNERTRCRLCGLVWLAKGDVCGPNLRSEKEQAQIDAESMARRAG